MTPEDIIQMHVVRAVRLAYPKALLFSVPNGGYRSKFTGAILKATGTMPGVSDLIFIFNGKIIFVEIKTEKGVQSKEQKNFEQQVIGMGFNYWIVRSADGMLTRIKEYIYRG